MERCISSKRPISSVAIGWRDRIRTMVSARSRVSFSSALHHSRMRAVGPLAAMNSVRNAFDAPWCASDATRPSSECTVLVVCIGSSRSTILATLAASASSKCVSLLWIDIQWIARTQYSDSSWLPRGSMRSRKIAGPLRPSMPFARARPPARSVQIEAKTAATCTRNGVRADLLSTRSILTVDGYVASSRAPRDPGGTSTGRFISSSSTVATSRSVCAASSISLTCPSRCPVDTSDSSFLWPPAAAHASRPAGSWANALDTILNTRPQMRTDSSGASASNFRSFTSSPATPRPRTASFTTPRFARASESSASRMSASAPAAVS
mmetsp:Transcript_1349/g.4383  ORF Transcript_1349/g.4383 Transcript_1349/m.4383 type:complete len:323 (-) Transcript_1349:208-1176(-)